MALEADQEEPTALVRARAHLSMPKTTFKKALSRGDFRNAKAILNDHAKRKIILNDYETYGRCWNFFEWSFSLWTAAHFDLILDVLALGGRIQNSKHFVEVFDETVSLCQLTAQQQEIASDDKEKLNAENVSNSLPLELLRLLVRHPPPALGKSFQGLKDASLSKAFFAFAMSHDNTSTKLLRQKFEWKDCKTDAIFTQPCDEIVDAHTATIRTIEEKDSEALYSALNALRLYPGKWRVWERTSLAAIFKAACSRDFVDETVRVFEEVAVTRVDIFMLGAIYGETSLVQRFLDNGMDINNQDEFGRTALSHVSESSSQNTKAKERIDFLVKEGSNVNISDYEGHTVLAYAVSNSSPEIISTLLDYGAEANCSILKWAFVAPWLSSELCARLLSSCSADTIANHGNELLELAVFQQDFNSTKSLLARGVDVNGQGQQGTSLHSLAGKENPDENDLQMLKLLIDYGGDMNVRNANGRTPLHKAVTSRIIRGKPPNHLNMVHALLEHGCDVNARDRHGSTPLHALTSIGMAKDIVDMLLKHEADVNAQDDTGSTALHKLSWREDKQWLIDRGADPDIRDNGKRRAGDVPFRYPAPGPKPTEMLSPRHGRRGRHGGGMMGAGCGGGCGGGGP